MTTELVLNILNLGLLGYIVFVKKYFEKKAENLATKEDIQEITRLTELSKIEFTKQIEEYKKELDLRYEFADLTKEFKIKIFQETVIVRKNLLKWSSKQLTPDLMLETVKLINEIIIDLNSNVVLYKQYSENTENIRREHKLLIEAIQNDKQTPFDPTRLQTEFTKLQDELIK
jgi:hypothetical protein